MSGVDVRTAAGGGAGAAIGRLAAAILLVVLTLPVFPLWMASRLVGWKSAFGHLPTVHLWLPNVFRDNPLVGLEAFSVAFLLFGSGVFYLKRKWSRITTPNPFSSGSKESSLHGSAKWANFDEIKKMALLPPKYTGARRSDRTKPHKGVFVGAYEHKGETAYLRHNGPEHVLAFAPTRSGKGVGLVLPTLYTWDASVLVHDPKGEAWALTSGFRYGELGQRVFNFDPTNPDTTQVAAFNPLAEVRCDTDSDVADAQNIGTILADPEGKGLKDHWDKTGQALISAVVLHVCYVAKREHNRPGTFSEVVEFLSMGELTDNLETMRTYPHMGERPHDMIAQEASAMLKKEEREMTSVASTAISYVTLYRDPVITRNTSRSDWTIRDLMHGDTPASAYLVVRPADADRLRPMMRLIATQIVRQLTTEMKFEKGRAVAAAGHRLLLLLDEFTALKKLSVIEEALAYMAGYGIKAYLIVQDIEQLKSVYGREETVISNCHIRVAFAPNKYETSEALSKMAGTRTVVHKQASVGKKSDRETWQETSRPLVTPDEVARLRGAEKNAKGDIRKPGDLLVFVSGFAPIYGRQVMYFLDPEMRRRSLLPPPKLQWGPAGLAEDAPADEEIALLEQLAERDDSEWEEMLEEAELEADAREIAEAAEESSGSARIERALEWFAARRVSTAQIRPVIAASAA